MDHRGGVEQLHFDVPLISTRRSASANASKSSRLLGSSDQDDDYMDTSRSVPFSWEAAPGVPKGSVTRTYSTNPPSGRWHPAIRNDRKRCNNADGKCGGSSDEDLVVVLDRVSLSESPDAACRLGPGGATRAPSFIMNRFLPAANALAAASIDKHSRPITPPPCSREQQLAMLRRRRPRGGGGGTPSSGCGLVELFPRSLKSVACRFKSPVRCQTPKIATLEALIAQRSRSISASDGDGLSSKACKSPGWGLPLPDSGRVGVRGARVDLEKGRRLMDGKESRDGGRRRTPRIATSGAGRPLPMLKSPTEPWLAHAVNSANRGY